MNHRRNAVVLALGGWMAPFVGAAERATGIPPRIGLLLSESPQLQASRISALKAGLAERGLVDGQTIFIDTRSAEGHYERLVALAADLVRLKVDVIVAFGIKALAAARDVTATVPIVIPATSSDLVAAGLARSLARPGGNVTGSTTFGPEIMAKRLELLKELQSTVSSVGVLLNPANRGSGPANAHMDRAARALRLSLVRQDVKTPFEFVSAFAEMAKARVHGLVVQDDTLFNEANSKDIAELSLRRNWISVGGVGFAEAGGTAGYGRSDADLYRRGAYFIEKILGGQKVAELPIEQATRFELVINLKNTRALGVDVPHAIALRANRTLE